MVVTYIFEVDCQPVDAIEPSMFPDILYAIPHAAVPASNVDL